MNGLVVGQNDSPNLESFELPELPECWSTINADEDEYDWENFYQVQINGATVHGHTGIGFMASASFDNADLALTPDNFLILPQLSIQAGENLTYHVAGLDPDWSFEHYAVVLSTSGNAAEDFTEVLLDETIESSGFVEKIVSLESYVGQEVYIAFRHFESTNQFQIRIDDVQYPTTVSDCSIIVSVQDPLKPQEFNLFPNPSAGIVTIETKSVNDQVFSIYNMVGEVVYSENVKANTGRVSIDLSNLSKGMYTSTLESKGKVITKKLILR